MPSPIDLVGFTILELVLPYFNPEKNDGGFCEHSATFTLDFQVTKNDSHPDSAQIIQTLDILFGESAESAQKGRIVILGQFSFPKNTSEEVRNGLLFLNGNSILYGALRGVFANITGTFHAGPIYLPTFNIKEIVEAKFEAAQSTQKSHPEGPTAPHLSTKPARKKSAPKKA